MIRRISAANPARGAPRIHGELGKLGIAILGDNGGQVHGAAPAPPSQTWRTFLSNHVEDLVSADFFVVPTATFRLLFVFVILLMTVADPFHFAVTAAIRPRNGQPSSSCGPSLGHGSTLFVARS